MQKCIHLHGCSQLQYTQFLWDYFKSQASIQAHHNVQNTDLIYLINRNVILPSGLFDLPSIINILHIFSQVTGPLLDLVCLFFYSFSSPSSLHIRAVELSPTIINQAHWLRPILYAYIHMCTQNHQYTRNQFTFTCQTDYEMRWDFDRITWTSKPLLPLPKTALLSNQMRLLM